MIENTCSVCKASGITCKETETPEGRRRLVFVTSGGDTRRAGTSTVLIDACQMKIDYEKRKPILPTRQTS